MNSITNGSIFTIVPNRLLLFAAPASIEGLPAGREYADEDGGGRTFSADYYGELFRELGVAAVVCLDRCGSRAK